MADNFFTDNPDLRFYLEHLDLEEAITILERGYTYHEQNPAAPRSYEDAVDNYRLLLELLGELSGTHIAPRAGEADEEGVRLEDGEVCYPEATRQALALLRQAGLMGAMLPREHGGLNIPGTVFQMMVEILSRADPSMMTLFGLQEISSTIAEFGDEEMQTRTLPRFARGEVTAAMVLTEPDAGSDLGGVQTRAVYDEEADVWRLHGVKRFITNGCADIHLVLARSEEDSDDARGLSLFLVERDETVHIRRLENKMGIHASPTCEIQYDGTPAELIGRRRFGLIRYAMSMMNGARLAVGAQALGIAEAAYREACRYAEKRIQFGQPIRELPAVYRMLLSMRGEIEAARALLYEAARWVDRKRAYELRFEEAEEPDRADKKRAKRIDRFLGVLTPLVKYYATEMGNRVCYQAMQVHGGAGYMQEFAVERLYRDMRVTSIYEGTSQLQVVAATGGLLGRALDDLLDEWGEVDVPHELAALKSRLEEATAHFQRCSDHLKGSEEQSLVDYYAVDLMEATARIVGSWLLLREADQAEWKQALARVYLAEALPEIGRSLASIQATDPAPVEVHKTLFSCE
jgi:hypothetical protein